ncbi:Rieske (2Fe-2S) protein [Marinimicrobium sp. C2-29]|uniref:Rieske (2Fe-2S) protein n=1 Tax=Marinimicrobium sp. C2-29 TaxID=3139825 RepID=UPI004053486C
MVGTENYESGTFIVAVEGVQYRVPAHCPHRGGRMDHGVFNERSRTITCPLHKSTFRVDTGCQLAGPECGRLATERVDSDTEPAPNI